MLNRQRKSDTKAPESLGKVKCLTLLNKSRLAFLVNHQQIQKGYFTFEMVNVGITLYFCSLLYSIFYFTSTDGVLLLPNGNISTVVSDSVLTRFIIIYLKIYFQLSQVKLTSG